MKKRLLIACTMQLDSIRFIMKKENIKIPVIWLERSLHHSPDKLHKRIQDEICEHQDEDEILLSYGLCGNAALGLCSQNTRLIMPAFDDCICQLLYRGSGKDRIMPEKGCFYLTREWTIDRLGIVQQCEEIYDRYGSVDGQKMIDEIYGGYHTLAPLLTGAYDVDKIRGYVDKAAKYTKMCVKPQKASVEILENMLKGDYRNDILNLQPGEAVRRMSLSMK